MDSSPQRREKVDERLTAAVKFDVGIIQLFRVFGQRLFADMRHEQQSAS